MSAKKSEVETTTTAPRPEVAQEPQRAQVQQLGMQYEHVEGVARALGGGQNLARLIPFLINLFKFLKDSGILTGIGQPTEAPTPQRATEVKSE